MKKKNKLSEVGNKYIKSNSIIAAIEPKKIGLVIANKRKYYASYDDIEHDFQNRD